MGTYYFTLNKHGLTCVYFGKITNYSLKDRFFPISFYEELFV